MLCGINDNSFIIEGEISMKKKIAMLLTAVMVSGLLGGCAGEDVIVPLNEMKVTKYVTLGEYTGLQVSVTESNVKQDEWDTLVEQVYYGNITAENGGIMDRPVENGDTVNIAFEGKLDGVAFEGGTSDAFELIIGSNRFIAGFEEGLVGVMPGETVDLDLTFPEGYQNTDLAGQDVVFTVTVHYIVPVEMQDSVVAGFGAGEFSNIEELRQYVYDYLDYYAQSSNTSGLNNAILEAFMASCEFKEIPAALIEEYGNKIRQDMESAAASTGMDADTYTSYYYGTNLDTYVNDYAEEYVKQSVAYQAVANAQGLNVSEEELNEILTEYAQSGGYASVEEFMTANPRDDYYDIFMMNKVNEFLTENAIISYN